MIQVRSYYMALDAVTEYVDSAKSKMTEALAIAREIEKADTPHRDDISTLIHNLEAAIEDLRE